MSAPFTGLYPKLDRLRPGSAVYDLLVDPSSAGALRRAFLDQLVAEAEDQGWLDTEAYGRLRAGDDAVVLSILDELAIARWLQAAGFALAFNPPGAQNRIGELLIASDAFALWLEVKSLLPAEAYTIAKNTFVRLQSVAATIPIPARLTLEIDHHPGGGISQRELRRYIEDAAQRLLEGAPPPPAYTHPSGVYLRAIACAPAATPFLRIAILDEPWPEQLATRHRTWSERLWRAIRGGYSQLPHSGPPSAIMVVEHMDEPPPWEDWFDPFQDLLRMGSHRHLSAVGRLVRDELWLGQPNLGLLINPTALRAFPEAPLSAFPERRASVLLPYTDGGADELRP